MKEGGITVTLQLLTWVATDFTHPSPSPFVALCIPEEEKKGEREGGRKGLGGIAG